MKRPIRFLILSLLLSSTLPALADGMFYWPEPVPPGVPYQRALLLFDGQYETLIVQSQYRLPAAPEEEFGWVVPVPSVPDLASMDAGSAEAMFRVLAKQSEPKVIHILAGFFWLVAAAAALVLVVCLLSFFTPRLRFVRRRRLMLVLLAITTLFLLCTIVFMGVVYIAPRNVFNPFSPPDVEVLRAEQVGIYDVQVVRSSQSQDLIQWLNQNQFHFDGADTGAFDQYVQRGWNFVVARIDTASQPEGQEIASEGLVAPLILRFPAEDPIYPLALTSTSGRETQILLYVLSDSKWQSDGRLGLQYASKVRLDHDLLYNDVEPAGFFSAEDLDLRFLCKFNGNLAPDQMREDLILKLAGDNRSYGKYSIRW